MPYIQIALENPLLRGSWFEGYRWSPVGILVSEQLVRQKALPVLAVGERIQAGACGYFIKPRAKGPALGGLKVVEASPGTQIRLLYEVLRFVDGAEHAVTVHVEFAAERFREPAKLLLPFRAFRLM